MTRETAMQLARQALQTDLIWDFESAKATHETRKNRSIWRVSFLRKEEPDVVISPEMVLVEVDEETEVAKVILSP